MSRVNQDEETTRQRILGEGIARFILELVTRNESLELERDTWKHSAETLLTENTDLRNRLGDIGVIPAKPSNADPNEEPNTQPQAKGLM